MDRRLFNPEDKIAPGLYMDYWQSIAKKYGNDRLNIGKLKPYREVRHGAILAALWTRTTGRKHFVSFSHEEPADVEIYSLQPTVYNDRPSYHLAKIPVQLTRCSLASGETVAGQVIKKNKPSLSETSLVVHMIGEDNVTMDLNEIVAEVRQIENIYPKEIALLAPLDDATTREQTFGQLLIYHREGTQVRLSKVHTGESDAFFTEPSVMQSQRRTGQAIDTAGQFNLLLP
jgi:hypothetical protein